MLAPISVREIGVFMNSRADSDGPPTRLTASRTLASTMPRRVIPRASPPTLPLRSPIANGSDPVTLADRPSRPNAWYTLTTGVWIVPVASVIGNVGSNTSSPLDNA